MDKRAAGIYALGAVMTLTGCEFNGLQRYQRLQSVRQARR